MVTARFTTAAAIPQRSGVSRRDNPPTLIVLRYVGSMMRMVWMMIVSATVAHKRLSYTATTTAAAATSAHTTRLFDAVSVAERPACEGTQGRALHRT